MDTLTRLLMRYPQAAPVGLPDSDTEWAARLKRMVGLMDTGDDTRTFNAVLAELLELEIATILRQPEEFGADGVRINQGATERVRALRINLAAAQAAARAPGGTRATRTSGYIVGGF